MFWVFLPFLFLFLFLNLMRFSCCKTYFYSIKIQIRARPLFLLRTVVSITAIWKPSISELEYLACSKQYYPPGIPYSFNWELFMHNRCTRLWKTYAQYWRKPNNWFISDLHACSSKLKTSKLPTSEQKKRINSIYISFLWVFLLWNWSFTYLIQISYLILQNRILTKSKKRQ